jgi:hypothetical protein
VSGSKAADPSQFHRGWPGAGFRHALLLGIAIGAVLWKLAGRAWGLAFMIGDVAHVLTDTCDSYGTMLAFPLSTQTVHLDAWAYAGQTGRFTDAAAYYSGPGFVLDGVFLILALTSWRVLTRKSFFLEILPGDVSLTALSRRISGDLLLVMYRVALLYGACRWLGWLIWAHVLNDYSFDLTWGGPHWVDAETPP